MLHKRRALDDDGLHASPAARLRYSSLAARRLFLTALRFSRLGRTQMLSFSLFSPFRRHGLGARMRRLACLAMLGLGLGACAPHEGAASGVTDISGHLPDLKLSLTADSGRALDQRAFAGQVVLLYYGYTHCPDVCPTTLAKLVGVVQELGSAARDVKIVFVTVDPARDTPQALRAYVSAFDPAHAVGLTGDSAAIEGLAKRYRVAYEAGRQSADGNYEVTHSAAVYIFDRQGKARLIATENVDAATLRNALRGLLGA